MRSCMQAARESRERGEVSRQKSAGGCGATEGSAEDAAEREACARAGTHVARSQSKAHDHLIHPIHCMLPAIRSIPFTACSLPLSKSPALQFPL